MKIYGSSLKILLIYILFVCYKAVLKKNSGLLSWKFSKFHLHSLEKGGVVDLRLFHMSRLSIFVINQNTLYKMQQLSKESKE